MSDDTSNAALHASLHEETGGLAGQGGPQPTSPTETEPQQSVGSVMREKMAAYKGSVWGYMCWGGVIGAAAGWLIGLAAGIYWLGGLIVGAICGGAIGLYVVETKRFR